MFTPARHSTPEFLDDPATAPSWIATSGNDIANCNRLFGGRRALLAELTPLWPSLRPTATPLDIGCGVGDLPAVARADAKRHGVTLRTIALDRRELLARRARSNVDVALVGDGFSIPLPDTSVDIVTACQFLHHFSDTDIARLAREMHRVARHRVVISDLRRSWLAAGGVWLASWPLRLHPITRHDGVASVLKGFLASELAATIQHAVERPVRVVSRPAFRLTASWTPSSQ